MHRTVITAILILCTAVRSSRAQNEPATADAVVPAVTDEPAADTIRRPQPPPRRTPSSARAQRRSRFLSVRRPSYRIARAPAIFGDSIITDTFDVAGVGFGRFLHQERNKIADNGKVLPQDRSYLDFRYFHNAVSFSDVTGVSSSESVERYRAGFERTITVDNRTSAEVRIPLTGGGRTLTPGQIFDADGFGNISLILKQQLPWYETDSFVWSAGVGVTAPTGEDVRFELPTLLGRVRIRNESWHVQPFLGALATPSKSVFLQGFAQLDIATDGSDVISNTGGTVVNEGPLDPAPILNVNLSGGTWLLSNGHWNCHSFSGVALLTEFHYTGQLRNTDTVTALGGDMRVGGLHTQMHILNATIGLHGVISDTTSVRIGFVAPLTDDANRTSDGEFIFTVMRRI